MCCSIRAAVFFLASLHVYFAVSQLVGILPSALSSFSDRALEAALALIFGIFFFSSGFMTFRGADEESSILIAIGGVLLLLILIERFILMHFNLLLVPTLPEGDFLNVYGTVVPVIFTILLYIFYLCILFAYHWELQQEGSESSQGFSSSPLKMKKNINKNKFVGNESPRNIPGAPEGPARSNSMNNGIIRTPMVGGGGTSIIVDA